MDKDYCYICGEELTKSNESEEHIIPNAIGGKLKSNKLICKKCNNQLGNDIDYKLTKQLDVFSNFLNIERERGKPNDIIFEEKNTKEKYKRKTDGTFVPKEHVKFERKYNDDGSVTFHIRATNKKDIKKKINELISSKKYKITDENIMDNISYENYQPNEMYHSSQFGGNDIKLALYKIIINFFISKGGDKKDIISLINDLKKKEINHYVKLISLDNADIKKNIIPHILYIEGNNKEHILYSYINFFGVVQYIVLINRTYTGPYIKHTYCYDFISKKEIDISNINFGFDYFKILEDKYDINTDISNILMNQFINLSYIKNQIYSLENDNLSNIEKSDICMLIADMYAYLALYDEAIEYYIKSINLGNLYCYYLLANIYFLSNKLEESISSYKKYLDLETNFNYNDLIIISNAFYALEEYEYFKDCCIRAASLNNTYEERKKVCIKLADIYFKLGYFNKAYKYYGYVIKLDTHCYDACIARLQLFYKLILGIDNNSNKSILYNNAIFANNLICKLKENLYVNINYINNAISDLDTMLLKDNTDTNLLDLKNALIELIKILEENI